MAAKDLYVLAVSTFVTILSVFTGKYTNIVQSDWKKNVKHELGVVNMTRKKKRRHLNKLIQKCVRIVDAVSVDVDLLWNSK